MAGHAVVVTGGGRGIGRAIALAFATPGNQVVICGRTESDLARTAGDIARAGAEGVPVQMDVTSADAVQRGFERIRERTSGLDVLVNNAGVGGGEPVRGSDIARWRNTIDTNLTGMYLVTREAVGSLRDGGRIINLSSVLGRFGVPGYTAYCASKHGVIGFTRALALELAHRRITVNALCPGWVDTAMSEEGMRLGAAATRVSFEEFRRQALDAVPLKRIIQPDEVAQLALFLATPAASMITGQTYNICGGQTMD
jgi:NAD(P)-dependent dehydrogenase (short-subunit alcohol dehydrogenase family)